MTHTPKMVLAYGLLAIWAGAACAQSSISTDSTLIEAIIPAPPGQDTDGDGFTDTEEYIAGTNPYNPDSFLGIAAGNMFGGVTGLVVTWSSVDRKQYSLFRATNLLSGFLAAVGTNIPAVPPMNVYTDRTALGEGTYFYRVRVDQ